LVFLIFSVHGLLLSSLNTCAMQCNPCMCVCVCACVRACVRVRVLETRHGYRQQLVLELNGCRTDPPLLQLSSASELCERCLCLCACVCVCVCVSMRVGGCGRKGKVFWSLAGWSGGCFMECVCVSEGSCRSLYLTVRE